MYFGLILKFKGIFEEDDKYEFLTNYIEFILDRNLNKNKIKCNYFTKEVDEKLDDD